MALHTVTGGHNKAVSTEEFDENQKQHPASITSLDISCIQRKLYMVDRDDKRKSS